jgi:hypothetical protein
MQKPLTDAEMRALRASEIMRQSAADQEARRLEKRRALVAQIEVANREHAEAHAKAQRILAKKTAEREAAEERFRNTLLEERAAQGEVARLQMRRDGLVNRALKRLRGDADPAPDAYDALPDEEVKQAAEWAASERIYTLACFPPFEVDVKPTGSIRPGGFNQDVRRAIQVRGDALSVMVEDCRELLHQALSRAETIAKLRELYHSVPLLPAGASLPSRQFRPDLPAVLKQNGNGST